MILVIGGRAAGKTAYTQSLGYTQEDTAEATLDERPVLDHLERLVQADPEAGERILPALLKKEVVICDEVGSGVIPASRAEREVREATGRLCIRLAQKADRVVRLVAGIPTIIKG